MAATAGGCFNPPGSELAPASSFEFGRNDAKYNPRNGKDGVLKRIAGPQHRLQKGILDVEEIF